MIALALLLAGPPVRDSSAIAAALRIAVAADANVLMHRPAITDVRDALTAAYEHRGWQPLWIAGQLPTPGARQVLAELSLAGDRGLDPEQYDAARLGIAADSLPNRGTGDAAAFDVALTAAVMIVFNSIQTRHQLYSLLKMSRLDGTFRLLSLCRVKRERDQRGKNDA